MANPSHFNKTLFLKTLLHDPKKKRLRCREEKKVRKKDLTTSVSPSVIKALGSHHVLSSGESGFMRNFKFKEMAQRPIFSCGSL